jgi:hypothetical protein
VCGLAVARNECKHRCSYSRQVLHGEAEKLPINLPPFLEQQEIARRTQHLFEFSQRVEEQVRLALGHVKQLTGAILAKAFRGELVPTEAELARREGREYEPASVLLDRINAEREFQTSIKPEQKRKRPWERLATAEG